MTVDMMSCSEKFSCRGVGSFVRLRIEQSRIQGARSSIGRGSRACLYMIFFDRTLH